jgi:hypothetical protein
MKTWIITLPFLFAAGLAAAATANEPVVVPAEILSPAEPAVADAAPAATPAAKASKARTAGRAGKPGTRSFPKGDVRHCLDKKTRAEIIRCSETGRGK